jgi:hypothetical protein
MHIPMRVEQAYVWACNKSFQTEEAHFWSGRHSGRFWYEPSALDVAVERKHVSCSKEHTEQLHI